MSRAPVVSSLLQGDGSALPAALRGLINNAQCSDVSFVVGKQRQVVHAHRCILMCRCKVFQRMFSRQPQTPKEMQVPFILADVQPEVFLAVIEFIYTNSVTLDSVIAAVTYGQGDMRQKCLGFIELYTQEIIKTQSFRELSDLGLVSILQSDHLAIDEVPLIQAVREWAYVSSAVLDVPVSVVAQDVVRDLRLVLLSPDELTTLERENAKDELIPEIQIAQAWKFHALKKVSDSNPHHYQRRKGTLPREHHLYLDPPAK
ncbi:BTB/POZ domain-containing protein 19 isoform X3 [Engystomops pustulosus]|uniref:BTB/POZ domain-containing protein 19 isoform X3 n=1 Tax=Engystomops pustulosus TaxID=76066 RepID=UPI003AFAAA85